MEKKRKNKKAQNQPSRCRSQRQLNTSIDHSLHENSNDEDQRIDNRDVEANVTNMKSYELRSKIKTENFESNVQMVTAGHQKKKETMNSAGGHGKPMNSEATATAVHKARKPRKSKSMKSDAEKQKCKKNDDTQLRVHNLRSRNVNMSSEVLPTGDNNTNPNDTGQDNDNFKCHVCNDTFDNYANFRTYRKDCTKIRKKYQCSKCDKGFQQKNIYQQYYNYHHTSKPKQFVCKICDKDFELKKVWKEHNLHLYSTGDYRFVCDTCSQGFYVLGEFHCHHLRHTDIKEYGCGCCGVAKFKTHGRLNVHLESCGKKKSLKCKICGKHYSSIHSLATHVSEVHNKNKKYPAPCAMITFS